MGNTRNVDFGPLQEVPSDTMNKFQETIFHSRATGAVNTLAVGLDAASTAHYSRKVVFSMTQAANLGFDVLDAPAGFDWRDRDIRVCGYMDPSRDIRPGEGADKALAKWRFEERMYSSSGNYTRVFSAPIQIQITGIGGLTISKGEGYLFLIIEGTVQVKERS